MGNSVTNWSCFQNRSPGGAQPELQTKSPRTVTSGRTNPKGNLANWIICHSCWYLSERRIQPVTDLEVRHIKKLTMCPKKKLSASLPKKLGETTLGAGYTMHLRAPEGLVTVHSAQNRAITAPREMQQHHQGGHSDKQSRAVCNGSKWLRRDGRLDGSWAHARSSLTGTSFQYHLEGDCSGGEGRKAGEEVSTAGARVDRRDTHLHTTFTREAGRPSALADDRRGSSQAPLRHWPLREPVGNSGNSARAGHQKGQEPTAIRGGAQRAVHAHLRKGGGSRKCGRGEVPTDSIPGVQVREGSKGTVAHPAAQGPAAQARPRRTRV